MASSGTLHLRVDKQAAAATAAGRRPGFGGGRPSSAPAAGAAGQMMRRDIEARQRLEIRRVLQPTAMLNRTLRNSASATC